MKLVEVFWVDAVMEDDYLNFGGASALLPIERSNLGYLVCDDTKRVIISSGLVGEDKLDDTFVIPKGSVTSIKELK